MTDSRWSYNYDTENRLIAMQTATSVIPNSDKRRLEFTYDYLGRRVRKIVRAGFDGSSYTTEASDTKFIYNGWNCIAALNANSSEALVASYFWGMDILGPGQRAGGIGGLLMIQEGGYSYVPAYDALGNVHAMIRTSDGTLSATYEYDAFGQTLRASGTYAESNPFRYSTKYTDGETGLVYFGLRYYSPTLGRFFCRDPLEESGGINLYAYVRNNAINRWDYLGLNSPDDGAINPYDHQSDGSLNGFFSDDDFVGSMTGSNLAELARQDAAPSISEAEALMQFGNSGIPIRGGMMLYIDKRTGGLVAGNYAGGVGLFHYTNGGLTVLENRGVIDAAIDLSPDPSAKADYQGRGTVTVGPPVYLGVVEDPVEIEQARSAPVDASAPSPAGLGSPRRATDGRYPPADASHAELVAWGDANRPTNPEPTGSVVSDIYSFEAYDGQRAMIYATTLPTAGYGAGHAIQAGRVLVGIAGPHVAAEAKLTYTIMQGHAIKLAVPIEVGAKTAAAWVITHRWETSQILEGTIMPTPPDNPWQAMGSAGRAAIEKTFASSVP